jgi:hypothetical protein
MLDTADLARYRLCDVKRLDLKILPRLTDSESMRNRVADNIKRLSKMSLVTLS